MNERIKELEKECWSHRVDGTLVDGQLHFDTKKFAELIVAECIKLNGKELAMPGHSRMVDVYCDHFGIKF